MLRAFFLAAVLLAVSALADDISGPLRMTLVTESWGTVYYLPADLKDYDYTPGEGLRTMVGKLGKVTIADAGIGSYNVTFPKGSMQVEGVKGGAKVTFFGQKYSFLRVKEGEVDELRVTTPTDTIRYVMTPHAIAINGKKGHTKITETEGDYQVVSSAGTYSYKPTDSGGFSIRGAPLVRFPYLWRGALFQSAGVGVFIDFKKLDPGEVLFRFSEWQPMLTVAR